MTRTAFVYLMGVRADGAYKIGCSARPRRRLKQVRQISRTPLLELVHVVPVTVGPVLDEGWAEAYLHQAFHEFRISRYGEWFALTAPAVELFKSIGPVTTRAAFPPAVVDLFEWNESFHERSEDMEIARVRRFVHGLPGDEARAAVRDSFISNQWVRASIIRDIDSIEAGRAAHLRRMQERLRALGYCD